MNNLHYADSINFASVVLEEKYRSGYKTENRDTGCVSNCFYATVFVMKYSFFSKLCYLGILPSLSTRYIVACFFLKLRNGVYGSVFLIIREYLLVIFFREIYFTFIIIMAVEI